MAKITVIVGPPASGKSTYAQDNAKAGDVVVDFDKLAQAFGSPDAHNAPKGVREVTFSARKAAIDTVLRGLDVNAWIIHTQPTDAQLADYEKVGAHMVVVDPGIDATLAQAEADGRPSWTAGAIVAWYERNAETARDT